MVKTRKVRWFVSGDVDGFFGLALDNLVQLLVIATLCKTVLNFSDALLFGHVLPGAAVSLVVGNFFYAWQAHKLAKKENRDDVCALPYGLNTVSIFAYIFLVMLPAKLAAEAAGAADPSYVAWQSGLIACLGSGLIELSGSFVAERLRRAIPRAALLSTLAGIALSFISLGFLFRTFAHPVVGLSTLAIIMLVYFGRLRIRGNIPGGLVAVLLGTGLSWLLGLAPSGQLPATAGFYPPLPVLGDIVGALSDEAALAYMSVIVPMGLFNVVGSLQNIESAEAAGDRFPTRSALAINGIGTLAAGLFGSCFPTTIYIGHPGWKLLGARAGYSILNGLFISSICLTGTVAHIAWAVPIDAGMAIVLWIGIVISAQAFQSTPRHHAPAVVVGLLPGIAAWGAFMTKSGLRVAGYGSPEGPAFSAELIPLFNRADIWVEGAFALEQGFIFSAMLLSAMTVAVIERRLFTAALWSWLAALLSLSGLMHAFRWTSGDTALDLAPAWSWCYGYLVMGLCFWAARWLTVAEEKTE